MRFTRITIDAAHMGGVPCIRHLRIPVATVVEMVAQRMAREAILEAYPDLEPPDIGKALRFAARARRSWLAFSARGRESPLRQVRLIHSESVLSFFP